MKLDGKFLSGFIVMALGFILPPVLAWIGWEIPLDFLTDGVITWRELIQFAGLALLAWSNTGQLQLRHMIQGRAKATTWAKGKNVYRIP